MLNATKNLCIVIIFPAFFFGSFPPRPSEPSVGRADKKRILFSVLLKRSLKQSGDNSEGFSYIRWAFFLNENAGAERRDEYFIHLNK